MQRSTASAETGVGSSLTEKRLLRSRSRSGNATDNPYIAVFQQNVFDASLMTNRFHRLYEQGNKRNKSYLVSENTPSLSGNKSPTSCIMKYRADIDGLRALAVIPVILFHMNIPGLSGGFVGVDIFFVISGFLITSIILKEINTDRFSIAKFYERRIRRIFPAFFPVIIFTLVLGYYWLSPTALKGLGDSVIASALFSSNILFWREAGYFDASSLQKPLLHTWSLAVEEQFYLFYPLLLVIIRKFFRGNYAAWLLSLGVVSFLFSCYAVVHKPSIGFYLLPSRTWELLVGAIVALDILPAIKSKTVRNLIGIAGTASMIVSIAIFRESMPFPGYSAAFPVLGAGAIIYVGMHGEHLIKKFFEFKPVVFIGMISYSLYLWHWPIIVFMNYVSLRELTLPEKLVIVLSTFLISCFSWKYVESPFRTKPPIIPHRAPLFALAAASIVIAVGIGGILHAREGLPQRLGLSTAKTAEYTKKPYSSPELHTITKEGFSYLIGKTSQMPSFLVWGDSHAHSLTPGMSIVAGQNNKTGILLAGPGIPPLIDAGEGNFINTESNAFNDEVINYLAKHEAIKTVFLASCWSNVDKNDWFQPSLAKTIDKLTSMNRHVVILTDVPYLPHDLQQAHSVAYRKSIDIYKFDSLSYHDYLKQNDTFFKFIGNLDRSRGVSIIDLGGRFYRDGKNILMMDDKLFYEDNNHLSESGSIYAARSIESAIMAELSKADRQKSHAKKLVRR